MAKDTRLAVLIDADNVSDKYVKYILDEVSNDGTATYKRIYGDWTRPELGSWKSVLLENSITPIQQYGYTTGKNATDSAMIIDAMDILYSGNVEGFCIVSSDSDFTRLASRLRESGMYVMGMGEKKTPSPFIAACNKFKYLEILAQAAAQATAQATAQTPAPCVPAPAAPVVAPAEQMTNLKTVRASILTIMNECSDEDGWISISEIGNRLNKRYPDFDVRNFGFRKLTLFLKSLNIADFKSTPGSDGNNRLIYAKLR